MTESFWDYIVKLQNSPETLYAGGVIFCIAVALALIPKWRSGIPTDRLPAEMHDMIRVHVHDIPVLGPILKRLLESRFLYVALAALGLVVLAVSILRPVPLDAGLSPLEFQPSGVSAGMAGTDEQLARIENVIVESRRSIPPDVRGVAESVQDRIASKSLIVFVHGWKGNESTFSLFPDLVKNDLAMQGYDTQLFLYPVYMAKRNLRVPDVADVLRRTLLRSGAAEKYENVYFVAHSLGGVIARKVFIRNELADNKLPIRGILSLGSPFDGTEWGRLAGLLGIGGQLTADLKKNSYFLQDLNGDWEAAARNPDKTWWYCFASPIDAVVSVDSATTGCGRFSEEFAAFGHIDMVKPEASNDERYVRVVGTILLDARLD
jgi:pimeloyl-ACP methyl ester carboxylesterase